MREWTVFVTAEPALMGNSADPLVWIKLVQARSAAEAVAIVRCEPQIADKQMFAVPKII